MTCKRFLPDLEIVILLLMFLKIVGVVWKAYLFKHKNTLLETKPHEAEVTNSNLPFHLPLGPVTYIKKSCQTKHFSKNKKTKHTHFLENFSYLFKNLLRKHLLIFSLKTLNRFTKKFSFVDPTDNSFQNLSHMISLHAFLFLVR
jgi:hypothetical protein